MPAPRLEAGELSISTATHDYLFRPSFAAMASLGTPAEIVAMFVALNSGPQINPIYPAESFRKWERSLIGIAYDVLTACCDEDVTPLIGHVGSRYGTYVPGAMPVEHMPHLARSLMKHGITGNVKLAGKPKADDYAQEFNAKDYVAAAIAHLGLSEDAAWNMTMTTFSAAMRSKFGKPENNVDDLLEKREADMAWLAEINKLRDRKVK